MALADLQRRPIGILCPMWTASAPGSKKCANYIDNGACALPTELMCVEWLIRNHEMPDLEDALRTGKYETPDKFTARFNREVEERARARGDLVALPMPPQLPAPAPKTEVPPTPEPSGPPAMTAPPNKLAEALAKLQSVQTAKPAPPAAKPSGGLADALARLKALK